MHTTYKQYSAEIAFRGVGGNQKFNAAARRVHRTISNAVKDRIKWTGRVGGEGVDSPHLFKQIRVGNKQKRGKCF